MTDDSPTPTPPLALSDVIPCEKCRALINDALIGACASVGIEHGRSTLHQLCLYLDRQHDLGQHAYWCDACGGPCHYEGPMDEDGPTIDLAEAQRRLDEAGS